MALAADPAPLPPGFTERVVSAATDGATTQDVERAGRLWWRFGIVAGAAVIAVAIAITGTILESRSDADRERRVLALLAGDDGISLSGEGDVIAKVSDDEFAIAGVEEAPEGKTYQLWLMRGAGCPSPDPAECELISAGTFDTEDGIALLELDENANDWQDAAVTVEDAGETVDFPTTDPFVHSL